jgi:predicted metalloprotease with PDZ domain
MMIKSIYSFLAVYLTISFSSIAQDRYKIFVNLNQVVNDKVKVVIQTPSIKEDKVTYIMPAVIPGSYAVKDYGRFIEKFTAYDVKGKKMKVKQTSINTFDIYNAKFLNRIEYYVNDTWDEKDEKNYVFQPGGTNIEAGKNFVINNQGFWGYFENYKMYGYEITVEKPDGFYGTTYLNKKILAGNKDLILAPNYVKLVDNPIMYCIPDTVSFYSGKTKIMISVYSQKGIVKAEKIKEYIKPLARALTNFLDELPVDEYYFIMYFAENKISEITRYGGFGALEHSYSSFYFLPEISIEERLKSLILSIASHEFLHILTPLNLHSEEIGNFDFNNPKMSQHLWLYEGVTEYFAHLVQLQNNLIDKQTFIEEIRDKMIQADNYPNVSFTEMSKNILKAPYKDMYLNVYNKGALLAFFLDLRIIELTNGEKTLKDVILELIKKYGPDQPFNDDNFINEFIAHSHPFMKGFFESFIQGDMPLPYKEFCEKIGWTYRASRTDSLLTFGDILFTFDSRYGMFKVIQTKASENVFELRDEDKILKVNGIPINTSNYVDLLTPIVETRGNYPITITYQRNKKILERTEYPKKIGITFKHLMEEIEYVSPEVQLIRDKIYNNK